MILLDVTVLSPKKNIFNGKARSVIVPGEQGVFEILPFHKRVFSRLISGTVTIDEQDFPIKRGVMRFNKNKVTVIIEEA